MFLVDEKLLQAILNYLANKPFIEVQALIAEIQKCKKEDEL